MGISVSWKWDSAIARRENDPEWTGGMCGVRAYQKLEMEPPETQPLIKPNNNINANIFLTNLPDCSTKMSISELNNQIKADRNKCNLNLPHSAHIWGAHSMVVIRRWGASMESRRSSIT